MDEIGLYPQTDMGNSLRFADTFRGKIKYDKTTGKWMGWDGRRWDREGGTEQAQLYCRGVAMEWRNALNADMAKDEQSKMFRHWQYSSSAAGVRNLLFLARSEPGLAVSGDMLDTHPMLLNVENGTIDLETGEKKNHDPDDLITQLAPVVYDPEARCPMWMECLNTWHPEDDGTIEYLQRLAGYCLTGKITSRCFPIFWGEGKNGKNTFLDTLMKMLGDYASEAPRSLLAATKNEGHPTEVASLWKKRLVIASEPEQGMTLRVGLVKSMTGDARIMARFMRQDFFQFEPTHKTIMMTQHLPRVTETENAIWDRLHKVGWKVRIPRDRQIEGLSDRLSVEWPGILNWALGGCLKWQEPPGILRPTARIERETEDYRREQNPAKKFVDSMLVRGDGLFIPSGELNAMLGEWNAWEEGATALGKKDLATYLEGIGCLKNKVRRVGDGTVKGWIGVGRRE